MVDPHVQSADQHVQQRDLTRLKRLYTWAGIATGAYIPFFVVYLSQRGVSPAAIGFTLAATSLISAVLAPAWGHIADARLGLVRALTLTLGLSCALMTLLYPHWPSVLLLCLFAVAFGSVFGTNPTISDALTLTVLGERRASAYGSVRLWTSLGWAIAVMVAGAFYQFHGLALMVPFALIGLIGMVVTVRGFSCDRHGPVIGAAVGGLIFEHLGSHVLFVGAAVGLLLATGLAAVALRQVPTSSSEPATNA